MCWSNCRPDHEGFSAGSLAALKQSQHVLGSLADKIRVPDQFVTAIETALGHHLQLVLTEQPEAAHANSGRPQHAKKRARQHCAAWLFMRNDSQTAFPRRFIEVLPVR